MSSTELGESESEPGVGRPVRDKERTRAALLDAAERVFAARGAHVSIAEIAAEAGVTKSGLLHHFPSRDALVEGVVTHVIDRIWNEVRGCVDETEPVAGRFTRAYVRASTGDSAYLRAAFGATGLLTALGVDVTARLAASHMPADAARLTAAFEADGLPLSRALAVRYAADGVLMGLDSPYVTDDQLALVRAELLELATP